MAKFKVKKSRQFSRKENEKEKKEVKLDKEKQKLKKYANSCFCCVNFCVSLLRRTKFCNYDP